MIKSKQDYREYRMRDKTLNMSWRDILFNDIAHFKILLRKTELYTNCSSNFFGKLICVYYKFRLIRLGRKLGFSIPVNVFGPGLSIAHRGTIVVNPSTRVGANCRLHVCVNIGATGGSSKAQKIGNNVYIAPGAKIFGDIVIANNIAIGANAVVNKSFHEENITIAGVPAKKISDGGSRTAGWKPNG